MSLQQPIELESFEAEASGLAAAQRGRWTRRIGRFAVRPPSQSQDSTGEARQARQILDSDGPRHGCDGACAPLGDLNCRCVGLRAVTWCRRFHIP
jgi:hypothetical protein